jgi:hypothetical protein
MQGKEFCSIAYVHLDVFFCVVTACISNWTHWDKDAKCEGLHKGMHTSLSVLPFKSFKFTVESFFLVMLLGNFEIAFLSL